MAKINNFDLQDKIKVHCTDNDETYEVDYISNTQHSIKTALHGVPLNFVHLKRNLYVANWRGKEFVMSL
jgi:hypothetical protein